MTKIRIGGKKFVKDVTPNNATVVEINGPNQFSAIDLHLRGTQGTGVTRTTAANGAFHLRLKQSGREVYMGMPSWAKLTQLLNYAGGTPAAESATAGAFNFHIIIPMYNVLIGDRNAIKLAAGDKLSITVPDMSATAFTTATLEINTVPSKHPQNYIPYWVEETDITLGGKDSDVLPVPNISILLMVLASGTTAPTTIGILKRGNYRYGEMSTWAQLVNDTNLVGELESAGTFVVIDFAGEMGDIQEGMGETGYSINGGSGSIEYLAFGMHPSDDAVLHVSQEAYLEHTAVLANSMARARTVSPPSASVAAAQTDY
jgi:hypothetical protein